MEEDQSDLVSVLEFLCSASPILEPIRYFSFYFYLHKLDFGFLLLETKIILRE